MDLSEKYLLLGPTSVPKAYDVEKTEMPAGIKNFELDKAAPLAARWSTAATCELQDGNPRKPLVPDCLLNTSMLLIISERLRAAFERNGVSDVEYLPAQLSIAGKIFDLPYFIVHVLNPPDCLDVEASQAKMGMIIKTEIDHVKKLVLKSDPAKPLFRLSSYYERAVFVSWPLADALSEIGFSGIRWFSLFDHPEYRLDARRQTVAGKKADALYQQIYERGKAQTLSPVATSKPKKRVAVPKDLKKWLAALPKKVVVENDTFVSVAGNDSWLDSFEDNRDDWPAFDPKRYYAIGTNENGNYWLLDLEDDAAVVHYSHEVGYNTEQNFSKVASLDAFKKMLRPA